MKAHLLRLVKHTKISKRLTDNCMDDTCQRDQLYISHQELFNRILRGRLLGGDVFGLVKAHILGALGHHHLVDFLDWQSEALYRHS